jgi:hypothetical protein
MNNYRYPRSPITAYFTSVVCLLLFACTLGASCDKSQRQDTLRASLITVNAARDGFTVWDVEHQQRLVEDAVDRETAIKAVTEYRTTTQKPIVDGFTVAYRALAVAATQTDEPSLKAALIAATELVDAVKRLTQGK